MQCECQTREHSEMCIFGKRDRAVDIAVKYINDDTKSKQWVLDKIIKILSGHKYEELATKIKNTRTNYSKLDSAIENTISEMMSLSEDQLNEEIKSHMYIGDGK